MVFNGAILTGPHRRPARIPIRPLPRSARSPDPPAPPIRLWARSGCGSARPVAAALRLTDDGK
ncbi:hypothetical protein GCM10011505_07240 [Tistrella bauzanensis]|uniref:Uncharacterized protein n=1 Tax=Tistrella bauzanensis TaxID=657419 RepID=A0ABQ1I8X1_9PROT|nr:hypothetical protein GCM10011505_07240 [Tistrella bauzanensis]